MRIDVHTHLIMPDFSKHLLGRSSLPNSVIEGGRIINCMPNFRHLSPTKVTDIEAKFKDMEAMNVDLSVLSHGIPGPELLGGAEADDWAARINDYLASMVQKYPDKFVAWGSIGFGSPERSVAELDRCINQLGFKGMQVFSNINQKVIDSPEFMPVYRHAAKLSVPINMHPTAPLNVVGMDQHPLTSGIGFIYDTSLGAVRLIRSGLFDEEPDLKLIVPHVGGILPYLGGRITRVIDASRSAPGQPKLTHPARHYIDKLFVDSIAHSIAALEFCYHQIGAERILYGTDHPYADYNEAALWVEQLHCTTAERELIYHGNAERLLGLNVT